MEAENIELLGILLSESLAHSQVVNKIAAISEGRAISDLGTEADRREIMDGRAAFALPRVETEKSRIDLAVSVEALASSQAETKACRAEMVASAVALALSRVETEGTMSKCGAPTTE